MKKFLLVAAMACVMTANAQQLSTKFAQSVQNFTQVQKRSLVMKSGLPVSEIKQNVTRSFAPKKASASVQGNYIVTENGDVPSCYSTNVTVLSETHNVDVTLDDGSVISVPCNVQFDTFCQGYAENVYAYFDENADSLYIPYQVVYNLDDDPNYGSYGYGKLGMYGCEIADDGEHVSLSYITGLAVNPDDNSLYMDDGGYYLAMSVDDEDAEYYMSCWTLCYEGMTMGHPNGTMYYYSTESGEWEEYEIPVYYDDQGTSVTVNNFVGAGSVYMYISDEDYSLSMPTGQVIMELPSSYQETYGNIAVRAVAIDEEAGTISADFDAEEIPGAMLEDGTLTLCDIDAGTYSYFAILSLFDSDSRGYGMGYYYKTIFTKDGGFWINPDAINSVNAEENKIDGKVLYNLAGQRIVNGYKGLIIKEGKKYLAK